MKRENSLINWVLGGALLLVGLLTIIGLVITRSHAEISSVQVNQVAPIVNISKLCPNSAATSCTAVTNFLGSPNSATPMDILVKITDLNGYADISVLRTSVRKTSVPLTSCNNSNVGGEYDGNNCYNNMTNGYESGIGPCAFDSNEGTTSAWWRCTVTLQPWMDATDEFSKYATDTWTLQVWAQDSAGNNAWKPITFENTSVLSMNFGSSTISYGQMSLGATQAGIAVLGTLYGNSDADMTIQANSAVMACDGPGSSSIPLSNQRFGTDNVAYNLLASSLSTTAQDFDFENNQNDNKLIARTSETTNPSDSVYFGIQIPFTGVSGTCSVTATILSVAQ